MKQFEIKLTNRFKKQLKRLQKQKNFNYDALDEVINTLASNQLLPSKYRNHLLEPKKNRNMGMSCTTRYTISLSKNRWFTYIDFIEYRFAF